MSNKELQTEVLDDLRATPAVRKSRTYLRARDGTVTVSGPVSSFSQKPRIDETAWRAVSAGPADIADRHQAISLD